MNAPEITVEHNGIIIHYNETLNRWEYNLRNRDRWAETLAKAKAAIEKPPPEEKKQFKRVECWFYKGQWDGGWKRVTVTSVAETTYGRDYVWVSDGERRSKERAKDLYPCGFQNDPKIAKSTELLKQISEIRKEEEKLRARLTPLEIPEEEDEEKEN